MQPNAATGPLVLLRILAKEDVHLQSCVCLSIQMQRCSVTNILIEDEVIEDVVEE
jgi:hypothetical protein